MVISAPMNEQELRNLMFSASMYKEGPFTIRYPRGKGVMPKWRTPLEQIKIGTGRRLCDGSDLAILTIGHVGNLALEARNQLKSEGIEVGLYDMRFVKPLDEKLLHEVFHKYSYIITVEDGCLPGGFGSAILEFMSDHDFSSKVIRLGMPDKVIEHGEQAELYAECGYDQKAIMATVHSLVQSEATV